MITMNIDVLYNHFPIRGFDMDIDLGFSKNSLGKLCVYDL